MSCDKQILIQKGYPDEYGDYDCDGLISFKDIENTIQNRYAKTQELTFQEIYKYIDYYIKSAQSTEILDTMNNILQTATTMERARIELSDSDSTRLRIANIPNNENPNNYDIFFKGKEVLEYKANLNGVGTLDNNQIHPIFKNLFNDDRYNSHIINGGKLYHARKEGNWNSDTVYKIFDNCNFKIESIDGIRYHDTPESNETRVENLTNDSVDVFDVSS